MKSGKILFTVFMAAALMILSACGSIDNTDGMAPGDSVEQESPENQETSNQEDPDQEEVPPDTDGEEPEQKLDLTVEDAYAIILNGCCQRDFIGGYLVDEGFLSWVAANYGEETIFTLADAVEAGQQDRQQWYQLTGNSIHVLWDTYCRETGFQDYRLERVYWKESADEEKIVLDFIGDINFAEDWSVTYHLDDQIDGLYDCLSKELLAELTGADIMMVNNEFTYSTRGTPLEGKAYTFRADPDRVYQLEIMGADIVSLANNHAYDYGKDALIDTLDTLEEAEVPYVGAGRNLEEAMKPSYFIINGRKIAIVSATQIERSTPYTKEATETEPGVLKTLNPAKFVKVIEEAETNADYVFVYVHWGTEHTHHFEQDQIDLADAFIAAGADVIIGGHTHRLQGIQYRKGVPVIYSLGNFWFNSKKLDTGISQVVIHKDGNMDFRFLPCVQKKCETYLVEEDEEKQRILDYMESISAGVVIDENGICFAGGGFRSVRFTADS